LIYNFFKFQKIKKIYETLSKVEKEYGLYYNYLSPINAHWCMKHASIGALGDSFYEYLLKLWLYENKSNEKTIETYLASIDAVRNKMVDVSMGDKLTYIGEIKSGRLDKKMDHLACFSGGLFALTSISVDSLDENTRKIYLDLAKNITNTCHESYIRTSSRIGPESFHFERMDQEAMSIKSNEKYYILRPEVIESYFYLWRTTKDNKYRDWAWDFVLALEKNCKTEHGYSGIKDVYDPYSGKDDVQQSFFFAETLKYLFLIFSDDSVIPLDKYVFNSEAHPFLIKK
jgi:mannosyl-oligosaccharide alpha-1,2-mannosidase